MDWMSQLCLIGLTNSELAPAALDAVDAVASGLEVVERPVVAIDRTKKRGKET